MKVNHLKFIRNILICIIAFGIVAFILNMAPGFKRDRFEHITNLIIRDENLTEELQNLIYISQNDTVYLSMEDCRNFLNSNIFYDEENKQITIIYENRVAAIMLEENSLITNGVNTTMLDGPIENEGVIYLPVSEMETVFNIDVQYIKDGNKVIIDKLDKGIIIADVSDETEIKFKPRRLSKTVGKLTPGEKVSCFYTTSRGWRLVRTEKGILRIC